jgi:hypothetical protein
MQEARVRGAGPRGPDASRGVVDGVPTCSPGLATGLKDAPLFFRDTRLLLHFRTYYRSNEASPDTFQEAWAAGGWLAYRSGWLADTFSITATGYFSLPVYAPEDKGGTLLLKPGRTRSPSSARPGRRSATQTRFSPGIDS